MKHIIQQKKLKSFVFATAIEIEIAVETSRRSASGELAIPLCIPISH